MQSAESNSDTTKATARCAPQRGVSQTQPSESCEFADISQAVTGLQSVRGWRLGKWYRRICFWLLKQLKVKILLIFPSDEVQ